MTIDGLAKLVIKTLDAQQTYFRTRNTADLRNSKGLESALRKASNQIIEAADGDKEYDQLPPDARPTDPDRPSLF